VRVFQSLRLDLKSWRSQKVSAMKLRGSACSRALDILCRIDLGKAGVARAEMNLKINCQIVLNYVRGHAPILLACDEATVKVR